MEPSMPIKDLYFELFLMRDQHSKTKQEFSCGSHGAKRVQDGNTKYESTTYIS